MLFSFQSDEDNISIYPGESREHDVFTARVFRLFVSCLMHRLSRFSLHLKFVV